MKAMRGIALIIAVAAGAILAQPAMAEESREQQLERAKDMVDTSRFKKAPPYRVGVAAGYLSNSWVVFALQHIRYEA